MAKPMTTTSGSSVAATVSSAVHPHQMAIAEAVAAAAAERLALVRAGNASGFRNVAYRKESNRYQARLYHNGKNHGLGFFHTPEEAALCVARWMRV